MLNLVRFHIEQNRNQTAGVLRYQFSDLRIWQETNVENFFKPRCVSCKHEISIPDTWGKNLKDCYVFQDGDLSRKGTVYSRGESKKAKIQEIRYTPIFTFMSKLEYLAATNAFRDFIPLSLEPFQTKFRVQLAEGLYLQVKLYNRNTFEGWELKIIYFCKNFRRRTKAVELDLFGIKQDQISDRQLVRDLTDALNITLNHHRQTILYDKEDGCLLLLVKDITLDTQPWCMIRFEGIKEGIPVYSQKKISFSEIPDGMALDKDCYVFWSEIDGQLKIDLFKKKQSKFFKSIDTGIAVDQKHETWCCIAKFGLLTTLVVFTHEFIYKFCLKTHKTVDKKFYRYKGFSLDNCENERGIFYSR